MFRSMEIFLHIAKTTGWILLTSLCALVAVGCVAESSGDTVDTYSRPDIRIVPDVENGPKADTLPTDVGGDSIPDNMSPCAPDDSDCDGVLDEDDNCPALANPDQMNTDLDGQGDVCDDDDDNDGVVDVEDAFPTDPDEWSDVDGDGIGDNADVETCDGIDNDGDGIADNGLEQQEFYADMDGDGFGASSNTNCASLHAAGEKTSGVYVIAPEGPGGPLLSVYCDMTSDGGGWTRIFYHDVAGGYFGSKEEAALANPGTPTGNRYSILSHLEMFRSTDGSFEFRIDWPDTDIAGRNIWRQTSNPTLSSVAGYEAVHIDYTNQYWGGLELSNNPSTYIDGSVNHYNWFYSIGSNVPWGTPSGIPAYGPSSPRVALWVRPDTGAAGTSTFACAPPPGYSANDGDCDDNRSTTYPGAPELCNALDDDCDGVVDPECPYGDVNVTAGPQPLQFYPRDVATNQCTMKVSGETLGAATEVQIAVVHDGEVVSSSSAAGSTFTLEVSAEAGLFQYDLVVSWDNGTGWWKPATTFTNILCGDVYLIEGQSNAVASDYHGEKIGDLEKNTFVRSYGSSVNNSNVTKNTSFHLANGQAAYGSAAVGQWGLRLANRIKDAQSLPILVINGAVGGTAVSQHQRNNANPSDTSTIYGRLLWRAQAAQVQASVRGIFWHQGESDGGMAYDTYLSLWTAMYEGWLQDYPNLEAVYTFQVRSGCGSPTWNRNVHRDLPKLLDKVVGHMSTTGVDGHDGCHFYHAAYAEWGERMARLVNRDLYGTSYDTNIEAPDPVGATWTDTKTLQIDFGETGNGLNLQPGAEAYFSLSDGSKVNQATVSGTSVFLSLSKESNAKTVSFVEPKGDVPWLVNDLGIGSFAWYDLAITP